MFSCMRKGPTSEVGTSELFRKGVSDVRSIVPCTGLFRLTANLLSRLSGQRLYVLHIQILIHVLRTIIFVIMCCEVKHLPFCAICLSARINKYIENHVLSLEVRRINQPSVQFVHLYCADLTA